jgi:hypothetical protein
MVRGHGAGVSGTDPVLPRTSALKLNETQIDGRRTREDTL